MAYMPKSERRMPVKSRTRKSTPGNMYDATMPMKTKKPSKGQTKDFRFSA